MFYGRDPQRQQGLGGASLGDWFSRYAGDFPSHRRRSLQTAGALCLLAGCLLLLWAVPVAGSLFRPGTWAGLAMFGAWLFYYRASRTLAFAMLALMVAAGWLARWGFDALGASQLAVLALLLLAGGGLLEALAAHARRQGTVPGLHARLVHVFVAPARLAARLYDRLGWRW